MNIESFCLLSSLSFAIEYTPRRAAVNRRKPPAPQRAGIFPLAKRREKNACFSHSEARLPSPEEPSEAARASADVPQIGTRRATFYIVPAPFMGTGLADPGPFSVMRRQKILAVERTTTAYFLPRLTKERLEIVLPSNA